MTKYVLFAHRIGLIGITEILVGLSGIILLPILTKNLAIEEYGTWLLFLVTASLIPMLTNLGLPNTMVRFLAGARDRTTIQDGFFSILEIVIFSSGIMSIVLFIAAEPIGDIFFEGNTIIAQILAVSIFILSMQAIFLAFFRTFQKIKRHSFFLFLKEYLKIAFISALIFNGYGILSVVAGFFIAECFVTILMGTMVIRTIGFRRGKFVNIKEYLGYGLPTVPGGLSSWVVSSSDRYLIGFFLGNASVGYYGPGYSLGSLIKTFFSPLAVLLPAVLSKEYDDGKQGEVKRYFNFSLKYFLAVAIPSVIGLSLLAKPILVVLSTPEIAARSYYVTSIVATSFLLLGMYTILVHFFILDKNTLFIGRLWIFAAIANFGLNLLFIPYYGIIGAAITTLSAYAFAFAAVEYYSPKLVDSRNIGIFITKSLFASLIISGIIVLTKPEGFLQISGIVLACAAIYFITIFLLKGFSKEEITFFKSIIRI